MVYEVHHNDLTQAQAADVAVLDFNATWCNPCRMLAPVLEQTSEELDGKALFYGIDVDENPALAAQARVVLDINKAERHIRGGLATKEKYEHRLQACSRENR